MKNLIELPDGSKIVDMRGYLIVIDSSFAEKYISKYGDLFDNEKKEYFHKPVDCKAVPFTTKKGRQACRITEGDTHTFWMQSGSGDRSWNDWASRRPANALYANAVRTSNGGGCWIEIIIMESDKDQVTSEQQAYLDELS